MPNRGLLAGAILAIALVGWVAASAPAQDTAPKTSSAPQAQVTQRPYRLDFTLTELESGKKIDTREYSMNLSPAGGGGRVQIGTRVSTGTKADGTPQYIDIGTLLIGMLYMRDGALMMNANCDVSSIVPDAAKVDGRPVLRTLTISNSTAVVEGKTVLVGTADDPDSKHEFELEVTVTEMK
jgi:hypothetical protein